ncbi:hypothetical protein FOL47_006315 [Perkinsus chesapeaki]|uniref:Uncharacterized protein n=1 Tax=Perkinsus chesapeaki TaxID=330153 RepID=A0A7J6MZX1_PERCH|nr:hypothetical protein FOL47_006315 [Perkinsus chesapeaki]
MLFGKSGFLLTVQILPSALGGYSRDNGFFFIGPGVAIKHNETVLTANSGSGDSITLTEGYDLNDQDTRLVTDVCVLEKFPKDNKLVYNAYITGEPLAEIPESGRSFDDLVKMHAELDKRSDTSTKINPTCSISHTVKFRHRFTREAHPNVLAEWKMSLDLEAARKGFTIAKLSSTFRNDQDFSPHFYIDRLREVEEKASTVKLPGFRRSQKKLVDVCNKQLANYYTSITKKVSKDLGEITRAIVITMPSVSLILAAITALCLGDYPQRAVLARALAEAAARKEVTRKTLYDSQTTQTGTRIELFTGYDVLRGKADEEEESLTDVAFLQTPHNNQSYTYDVYVEKTLIEGAMWILAEDMQKGKTILPETFHRSLEKSTNPISKLVPTCSANVLTKFFIPKTPGEGDHDGNYAFWQHALELQASPDRRQGLTIAKISTSLRASAIPDLPLHFDITRLREMQTRSKAIPLPVTRLNKAQLHEICTSQLESYAESINHHKPNSTNDMIRSIVMWLTTGSYGAIPKGLDMTSEETQQDASITVRKGDDIRNLFRAAKSIMTT